MVTVYGVAGGVGGQTGGRLALVVGVAAVVGLFVGSFLNVVVYRAPLGLSVSTPRSFCPTCDRQLAWWENVPLVSWLALRGRCHTCHEPISPRYPLVEAATAVAFALVAVAWHGSLLTACYCALTGTALAVALVEGWRGEVCHVALTGIGGRFRRYKITDSSFHNWTGLALALRGQAISDLPLCNKSFNLSYCGFDL